MSPINRKLLVLIALIGLLASYPHSARASEGGSSLYLQGTVQRFCHGYMGPQGSVHAQRRFFYIRPVSERTRGAVVWLPVSTKTSGLTPSSCLLSPIGSSSAGPLAAPSSFRSSSTSTSAAPPQPGTGASLGPVQPAAWPIWLSCLSSSIGCREIIT